MFLSRAIPPLTLLLLLLTLPVHADKEYRTISAGPYELNLRKSGGADLLLTQGGPVFLDMMAACEIAGKKPRALPFAGTGSGRGPVRMPIGQGQGFYVLAKEGEWQLNTHTARPFFTTSVRFKNNRKKPVQVSMLSPWWGGDGGIVHLGEGTPRWLTCGATPGAAPEVVTSQAESTLYVAAANPGSGRVLVAGWLTPPGAGSPAELSVRVVPATKRWAKASGVLLAECRFDPPVTVPPDGELETPVFYVAVAETSPVLALARYGRAVEVMDGAAGAWTDIYAASSGLAEDWAQRATAGVRRFVLPARTAMAGLPLPVGDEAASMKPGEWRAWLTASALLGAAPETTGTPTSSEVADLARMDTSRGVRPLDVFSDHAPRVWSVRVSDRPEEAHVFALFNLDSPEAQVVTAPFAAAGLFPDAYYTVFDLWDNAYVGTAQGQLSARVGPRQVRLYALRRFDNRPEVIASDGPLLGGYWSQAETQWDAASLTLSGRVPEQGPDEGSFTILVPEPYTAEGANGRLLDLPLAPGPWQAAFRKAP